MTVRRVSQAIPQKSTATASPKHTTKKIVTREGLGGRLLTATSLVFTPQERNANKEKHSFVRALKRYANANTRPNFAVYAILPFTVGNVKYAI